MSVSLATANTTDTPVTFEHLIAERGVAAMTSWRAQVDPYLERVHRAEAVQQQFEQLANLHTPDSPDQQDMDNWLRSVDPSLKVGSRHHTVPRFLLEKWAQTGRVAAFSKITRRHSKRRIGDLAQKDFYTIVDSNNQKNALVEELLTRVENDAAPILHRIANPLSQDSLQQDDPALLATFLAYQLVRTVRRRREIELTYEYAAKLHAAGRVPDKVLERLDYVTHPNEAIGLMGGLAQKLFPVIVCRPLAVVTLQTGSLLVSDEPVIVSVPEHVDRHHPDCFITSEEVERRKAKARRTSGKGRRYKPYTRVSHLRQTGANGVGVADELLLPIGPRTALVWGPLRSVPFAGPLTRMKLTVAESLDFVTRANHVLGLQALDWIISTVDDESFGAQSFPESTPLLAVCDGDSPASRALNEVPRRIRPSRLWFTES